MASDRQDGWFPATFAAYTVTILTGIIMAGTYRAARAVETTEQLRQQPWLVNVHYWATFVCLVVGTLGLVQMVFRGASRTPSPYYGLLALVGAAFLGQLTGNALPADAHDLRTVAVEIAISERMPVAGPTVANLIRGPQAGFGTLARWYGVHVGLIAVLFLPMILRKLRRDEDPAPTWKMAIPIVLLVLALGLLEGPRGAPGTLADFGNFTARPSYYTLPLHGALRVGQLAGAEWLGTAIFPTMFVGFLLILPRLKDATGKLGFLTFAFAWVGITLGFGGVPAPISGNQDLPEETVSAPQTEAKPISPALVAAGKKLFTASGCAGCHGIDGSKGTGGPDLSTIHERHSDPDWYVRYIKKPTDVVPTSTMPAFGHLPGKDLEALAEYLRAAPSAR
jgi:mono/diheme cytochrome c family protein